MADLTAVLVDGDNIAADHEPQIMKIAGKAAVARVYLNARLPGGWLARPKFEPRDAGEGKNAADVLLAIEAMDLLQTGRYGRFVIVTSDGDFRHIARRLRLGGAEAVGVGEAKTPAGFRDACTDFHQLRASAPKPSWEQQVYTLIANAGADGLAIASINGTMRKLSDFKIGTTTHKSWRSYLTSMPQYRLDQKGPDARVWCKTAA